MSVSRLNFLGEYSMRMTRLASLAIVTGALALLGGQAEAGVISGLFSTGVDNAGNTMSGGTVDTHYVVTSDQNGVAGGTFVVPFDQLPSVWVPASPVGTPTSEWISGPTGPPLNQNQANGPINYETTFTVTGPAAGTTFSGMRTADDEVRVMLNGAIVADFTPNHGYGSFFAFTVNSGFVTGLNTLDYLVENTANGPQGLRVQINAVPEPGTVALSGVALLFVVGRVIRRRRAA